MPIEWVAVAIVAAFFLLAALFLLRGRGAESDRLLTASRIEAEATRARLADAERALTTSAEQSRMETQAAFGVLTTALVREQGEARALLESKLREMGEQAAGSLAAIRAAVEEQLRQAVERQMTTSFQRVADQVAGVQRAMADLQAVAVQVGDLKRLFSNVKSRGGWGEAQLRALLDDHLPEGAYETNRKLREGSDELVEFAIRMPARGEPKPLLAVDAKFPTEDYERLLTAAEDGDIDAERAARRALDTRLRNEARSIAAKYICPPVTVDFAVMYLPTDGLYMEAARSPGLIESCGREHRVLIVGPTLCPGLLRSIQLGHMTLTVEQNAKRIEELLGAVRTEMGKMDKVLERLGKQAGSLAGTIEDARTRTRAVDRKLRGVAALAPDAAQEMLGLEEAAEGSDVIEVTNP